MFNIGFYGGTFKDKNLLIKTLKNSQFKITTDSREESDFIFMLINDKDDQKLSQMYDNCAEIMETMDPLNVGIIHSYDISYKFEHNKKKYTDTLLDKFTEHKFNKTDLKILYFPFGYDYDSLNEIFKDRYDRIIDMLMDEIVKIIELKKNKKIKKDKKRQGYYTSYDACLLM